MHVEWHSRRSEWPSIRFYIIISLFMCVFAVNVLLLCCMGATHRQGRIMNWLFISWWLEHLKKMSSVIVSRHCGCSSFRGRRRRRRCRTLFTKFPKKLVQNGWGRTTLVGIHAANIWRYRTCDNNAQVGRKYGVLANFGHHQHWFQLSQLGSGVLAKWYAVSESRINCRQDSHTHTRSERERERLTHTHTRTRQIAVGGHISSQQDKDDVVRDATLLSKDAKEHAKYFMRNFPLSISHPLALRCRLE